MYFSFLFKKTKGFLLLFILLFHNKPHKPSAVIPFATFSFQSASIRNHFPSLLLLLLFFIFPVSNHNFPVLGNEREGR